MTVRELVEKDKCGAMYRMVDAKVRGYMSTDIPLIEADRNVVVNMYGDYNIVGFSITGKGKMDLYVKGDEDGDL